MTATTSSRAAGILYLLYIAAGMGSLAGAGGRELANLAMAFSAMGLGVTLYALTRHVDHDLATMAMACRLIEAVPGNGEFFFAAGSTIFCWLLLKGKLLPPALAWLGLASSAMLVALQLAQAGGLFGGRTDWSSPMTWIVWLPMLVFELTFAVWLLAKGVRTPQSLPA